MNGVERQATPSLRRRVFMVTAPMSLEYSRFTFESLFRNCDEPIHLHLITDSEADKQRFSEELSKVSNPAGHLWTVYAEDELADLESTIFGPHPNLRLFRHGHPCWRKITDPILLSGGTDEIVLLDPDIYFPNRFRFETTPQTGVLLMWQKPICLIPPTTMRIGMEQGIRFAHHVDIGVSGWRAPIDIEWMEWLLTRLDCRNFARMMHIEAIVWAAIAMHIGGGYLDPDLWHCWHRTHSKRFQRKFGRAGVDLLRSEDFAGIKCFHAGGEAKWWLAEAKQLGLLDQGKDLTAPGRILPFKELKPSTYYRDQNFKSVLSSLHYYSFFNS